VPRVRTLQLVLDGAGPLEEHARLDLGLQAVKAVRHASLERSALAGVVDRLPVAAQPEGELDLGDRPHAEDERAQRLVRPLADRAAQRAHARRRVVVGGLAAGARLREHLEEHRVGALAEGVDARRAARRERGGQAHDGGHPLAVGRVGEDREHLHRVRGGRETLALVAHEELRL
jgi:hypothetical protein